MIDNDLTSHERTSLRKCSSRFWDRCSSYHPTQSSSGVALGKTSTNLRAARTSYKQYVYVLKCQTY